MAAPKKKTGLLKISTLAKLSGVSPATIKHYIREGLLEQAMRTYPNMAYYDPELVPRIKAIKELQRSRFLPLRVIKQMLDDPGGTAGDTTTADVVARVLAETADAASRTRKEIVADGYAASELDFLRSRRLVTPEGQGPQERYSGDDLMLVRTLLDARRAGLTAEMLPLETLEAYAAGIRELVRTEFDMFRSGVLPRAGDRLPALAEAAAVLSERLVVLLRRKLLLPTLSELMGAPLAQTFVAMTSRGTAATPAGAAATATPTATATPAATAGKSRSRKPARTRTK